MFRGRVSLPLELLVSAGQRWELLKAEELLINNRIRKISTQHDDSVSELTMCSSVKWVGQRAVSCPPPPLYTHWSSTCDFRNCCFTFQQGNSWNGIKRSLQWKCVFILNQHLEHFYWEQKQQNLPSAARFLLFLHLSPAGTFRGTETLTCPV